MLVVPYRQIAAQVVATTPRLGPVRLVGVDGPTGSGKSTFARRLVRALEPLAPVSLIHTDDLLDGWQDTVTFWPRLDRWVLEPLRHGSPGAYRTYDWYAGRFGERWTAVPPAGVVVLDGVSSTRAAVAPELTLAVWLQMPFAAAVERAVARDGESARAELEPWHERERAHFAADRTADRAAIVADGDPAVAHTPEEEFVAVQLRGCLA